jgi:hypothetical protein
MKRYLAMAACVTIVAICIASVGFAEKAKKTEAPPAIGAAIKVMFPQASIAKVEKGEEEVAVYEVETADGGTKMDITVTPDGMVAAVESDETADALPGAVKAAVGGAEIKEASKEVSYAELKYVKLAAPVTTYEVTVVKDGKEVEMKFSADGKVISQKVEDADKEDNGKDKEQKGEHKDKGEKDNDDKD